MGFDTSGYVLKSARSAPSNATSTAGASSGVLREHANLPGSFDFPGDLVEIAADQYRAAVLDNPTDSTQEYLFWAANSSNLAILEDPSWVLDQATGTVPKGTLTVGVYTDGTDRVIVTDNDDRSIGAVVSLTIVRGDLPLAPIVVTTFASQDADAGVVTLNSATLTALGGGLSKNRGDTISQVTYYLAAQKFWWTRNDSYLQRFGWNGSQQKWMPFKGNAAVNLGIILEDESYTLEPRPSRFNTGDYLPGDTLLPDSYAMIRVGLRPDANSDPAVVLVVTDTEAAEPYSFPPNVNAVVGVTSGVLQWNPAFVASNAGRTAWYLNETYVEDSSGIIGDLKGADLDPLFICPIPELTDRPFIRLGSRRHLRPLPVNNDAELALLTPAEGEVGWSRSTGQLKFSDVDIQKADPDAPGFELLYLGAKVVYDGVSMTRTSVGTRKPVQIVDDTGTPTVVDGSKDLFIPASTPLPSPGTSGVMLVPDETGIVPNTSATPGTRPNGSGLVRKIAGSGDLIVFGIGGAIESLEVVEFEDELPKFPFLIRKGRGVVALELNASGAGSKLEIGRKDRQALDGQPIYFLQAEVQAAIYADQARVISRLMEPFVLDGTEVFAFAIDGTTYVWNALLGAGSFTASAVATSLNSIVSGTGQVVASNGRIIIESGNLDTGSVEIGFGTTLAPFLDRDLSGCAVFGFPPGWRVDDPSTNDNWLPDSGVALGVYRSPQNRDRTQEYADFKARGRFNNAVFSRGVLASPSFLLNNNPLLDVAGFNEGIFFQIIDGRFQRLLQPFEDVYYQFEENRFSWAEVGSITAAVTSPIDVLPMGNSGVIGLTLHPAVGNGYGLYLDESGGPFSLLTLDTDYLLAEPPGEATLIDRVGGRVAVGARGSFTAGGTTFTDPDATFVTDGVVAGYRLKVTGGPDAAQGSYIVASVTNETTLNVEAAIPFPETGSGATWEMYEGVTDAAYDPSLLADVIYEQFNHLPSEPFRIWVLAGLGPTPPDDTTRLNAVVTDALTHGRPMWVRFGQDAGSPEATLTALTRTKLGVIINGSLAVPNLADPHFTNAAFSILVGDEAYTISGSNLVGVNSFTVPLPGDLIEYGLPGSGIDGQLNFGETTLDELETSYVYYVQEFTASNDLAAGEAEVDPVTGDLNLSDADMTAYTGTEAYFVEQMITEDRLDVAISPMNGSTMFNRPMRAGQIVEVSYYQADTAGNQVLDGSGSPTLITEKLPLFVRLEQATYVSDLVWSFNPTGRTVRGDVPTQVWVNQRLMNYSNVVQCTVDATTSTINFVSPVPNGSVVQITYAVNEAFGGESAYTVSTPPVYRPPFFLEAGVNPFTLESDRTADLVPGKLLRVGATPFYIKSSVYLPIEDETQVFLFPTPLAEAGSRAPGNDALTLLTSEPVTTSVDGNPTGGAPGFLLTLAVDYEPVDRGMLSIVFKGNVTQFTVAGHLMEIGGYPLIIASSTLSEDGTTTRVDMTSPFDRGFDPTVDAVKVSVRPIYPPDADFFLSIGLPVASEAVELVLFGETNAVGDPVPGRTLVPGRDYEISTSTGEVTLLNPPQRPLQPGQKLFLSYTKRRGLAPLLKDGMIIVPRYRAKYVHVTTPTKKNGFLNAYLIGTYTFSSPDAFYVRTVPLVDYMGEVAQIAASRVSSRTPHGGPMVTTGPSQNNWDFGTVPIQSQERELQDQDRAARVFISLYDEFVRAFEQVNETIAGEVVGDRDGKFRFFVGRDRVYGGPGYEDQITGLLTSRFVWGQVFEAANGNFEVSLLDPIVNPVTATQDPVTKEVDGDPMDPWMLDFYIRQQRALVLNDMDDTILAGKERARLSGFITFKVFGDFRRMWEPSVISRLFPERTTFFTTTYPGIEAGALPNNPGEYAFLKMVQVDTGVEKFLKRQKVVAMTTFKKEIADISNPVLGLIQNITEKVEVLARYPRARIWAYSATGFPDIDPASDGMPAVIATPLLLKDFPLDPDTGLPDLTQLTAGGGSLYDLSTGDPELSTPPWEVVDSANDVLPQVSFGSPDGSLFNVGQSSGTFDNAFGGDITFDPVFKGVFVGQVLSGCIITFADEDGNAITDPNDIVVIGPNGTTEEFSVTRGDTIYVINPNALDPSALSNPPTEKELKKFEKNQPYLKVGVKERSSAVVDHPPVFPYLAAGDRHAQPLMAIESEVEFANSMRDPLNFPALLGGPTNDSGDYGLPYLTTTNTELDRLGAVQGTFTSIVQTDGPFLTHTWLAVYPDEIVGNDGSILSAASGTTPPATLLSSRDFTPVATAGVYTPHSGIGDVRRYDLLLVQKGQTDIVDGAEGILSVGEVTTDTLEVPRFVTPTVVGTRIRYTFGNAMVHLTTTFTSGVIVQENGGLTTTFNITSVGGLFLNNGAVGTVGGLNNIVSNGLFAYPNNNRITLEIISNATGLVVETITIQGNTATGGAGAVVMGAMPTFSQKVLTVTGVGFVNFANLGTVAPGPSTWFDFKITVDTFVTAPTVSTGSATAYVDQDRLTFIESMDLRTVRPRGATTIGLVSVQGELSVFRVEAAGTDTCTVNNPATVNGGDPFTFLARDSGSPNDIGTFDPSPGTGAGSVKVMAFEGHNNTPIPTTGGVTFSAIPSSDQNETGEILWGTGEVYDDEDRIRTVVAGGASSLENVQSGDIVVITGGVGEGAVTTGTYIVRHAVPDDGGGYAEVAPKVATGVTVGWLKTPFPKVQSATLVPFEIVTSSILAVSTSPSGYNFPASGRLFLIPNINDPATVISVAYASFSVGPSTVTFSLTAGSGLEADGTTLVTNANVIAAATAGTYVSGMTYLPIGQFPSPAPSNNTVGHDNGGTTTNGFVNVTFEGSIGTFTFAFGVDLVDSTTVAPSNTELGVSASDATTTNDSTSFVTDITTPVYRGVPLHFDLTGIDDPTDAGIQAIWNAIHGQPGVACLLPNMTLFGSDGAGTLGTGFRAQAGVFIEPSVFRPILNLGNGEIKVVDAGNSALSAGRIGMRNPSGNGGTSPETVNFRVRRIRRFHEVLDGIGTNLGPLRYAYDIRTGSVASYTASTRTLVANGTGTQLGGFDDPDVNINAGDVVRILDSSGNVVDSAEIAAIIDSTTLRLRSPGFTAYTPVLNDVFQVYLKQAPVPHAQSNEQLLELITDQVILTRTADPSAGGGAGEGGRVVTVNQLQDNGIANFAALNPAPEPGDIVLVDSAGALEGPTGPASPVEYGARPVGDQSVSTRTDGSHIAGGPSELDDNRGWYRITDDPSVTLTYLAVSGETEFTGPSGTPVIFGSAAPTNQQYVVYPDITGSGGPSGPVEGQMDLRLTHTADGSNSYQDGSFRSIEPFSYRIIRPTKLVSEETVDLVLMMRERMLSFLEEMDAALNAEKQGSYYIFQQDQHIGDLGSATDGDDGLGVPSNIFITSLSGLTQYAPFANVSDCLSVLDRRYWVLDTRLDSEFPPYSVAGDPYSSFEVDNSTSGYTVGSGRPVEPDLVEEVLDRSDRLRALRYSWIKFRANRENGTLFSIDRFLLELPRLLQEQEDLLRLQQSLSDAE